MESPKEGVFVSKRDNNTDSVADGLLHDIRFDIRNLTHYLTQLSDEAETRGMEAAQEAVTHRNGIDETLVKLRKCTSKQINGLDGKVDTIQKTLDTMIDQLQKDITREITSKLTSKLRGGFIKLAVAAAAMIMLLCFRAWRLRKQKRSVSLMSLCQ